MQRLGVQHELAAARPGHRRRQAHLAAELVGCSQLALADALHLGGMQSIDLGTALALILGPNPDGESEQGPEALLEHRVALDLAADVADHPAEPSAQKPELAPGPLELMRMAVAPDHDGGTLGHAHIALAQPDAVAPGQDDELDQGPVRRRASLGCATALGCTVVSTATRSRSLGPMAPVLCATDRLSWISATSCSSPSRWRQRVIDDRSNGSGQDELAAKVLVIRVLDPAGAQVTRAPFRRRSCCSAPGIARR